MTQTHLIRNAQPRRIHYVNLSVVPHSRLFSVKLISAVMLAMRSHVGNVVGLAMGPWLCFRLSAKLRYKRVPSLTNKRVDQLAWGCSILTKVLKFEVWECNWVKYLLGELCYPSSPTRLESGLVGAQYGLQIDTKWFNTKKKELQVKGILELLR